MSDIEPELERAWRSASTEQPPVALDEALRAAARREVGAKPGAFRAAPRWLPLAAAATIAAIAVGIVQMTPPEQVMPAMPSPSSAMSDLDVQSAADKPTHNALQRTPREAPAAAPGGAAAPAPPPQAQSEAPKRALKQQRTTAEEIDRAPIARNRSDAFAAAPAGELQEKKALGARQAVSPREEESAERDQAMKAKTELAAASPMLRPSPATAAAPAAADRGEPQPFPAPAPARGGNAPQAMIAPAPAPAESAAAARASPVVAGKLAAQSGAAASVSGADAKNAANAAPAPAQDVAALAKTARANVVAPERRKDAPPLAPEEWIKRIRRLIAEGRADDAAKELADFRREYKDRSDSLLPSDLRTFKP